MEDVTDADYTHSEGVRKEQMQIAHMQKEFVKTLK